MTRGDAPIILTAPHGGTLSYPFNERSCTDGQACALDTNTRQLALTTSNEFYALTGLRPYVVIAQGHRRFIDLNRSSEEAYDDQLAAPYYDYYHNAIDGFVADVRQRFGRGLLMDIHGQSAEPDTILRGTLDGLSVTEMLNALGEDALNGPGSVMRSFDEQGFKVYPDVDVPYAEQEEDPHFSGAYTVEAYGSNNASGIDTIQLEFGYDYRGGESWRDTAAALAVAMQAYHETYLSDPILPGDYNDDGTVDAADFTAWRDSLGGPAGSLPNSIVGGPIGMAHYDTWVAHFGDTLPLNAPIPEPMSGMLLVLGVAAGLFAFRSAR
ncbi:N-formylglutamate amidohydrolase [Pseudobythopirellula maris]|uniref:N-formylglutamate amidohydrolase n=1 Tax=Pseudobythopirellula maris TaxID=2527991 RepID=UPI0018D44FE5|nr:N-formylglutamate amidohydrolase [Pseudobythopirellula maris]